MLNSTGVEFAAFAQGGDPTRFLMPKTGTRHRVERLHVFDWQPVSYDDERLGSLELTANVRGSVVEFATTATLALVALLAGAMTLAVLLAARLRKSITEPLEALAETAHEIAERKDYELRAQQRGDDEIGALTDAFNEMLAQVHARDVALREAQEQLSARVVALQHEIAERQRAEVELAKTHSELVEASRRAGQLTDAGPRDNRAREVRWRDARGAAWGERGHRRTFDPRDAAPS